MNDRQLLSFIAAADAKSFSKAAADSYISAPALINQINLLERDTDLNLFDRNSHGIELTEEGKIFYEAAKKAMAIFDDGIRRAHTLRTQTQKTIIMCGGMNDFTARFKGFCLEYQSSHPEIQIVVETNVQELSPKRLLEGEVQIMACPEPNEELAKQIVFQQEMQNEYSILLPTYHPLAASPSLKPEQLAGQTLIVPRHCMRRYEAEQIFAGVPVHLEAGDVYENDTLVVNSVLRGKFAMKVTRWCGNYEGLMSRVRLDSDVGWVGLCSQIDCPDYVKEMLAAYEEYKQNYTIYMDLIEKEAQITPGSDK